MNEIYNIYKMLWFKIVLYWLVDIKTNEIANTKLCTRCVMGYCLYCQNFIKIILFIQKIFLFLISSQPVYWVNLWWKAKINIVQKLWEPHFFSIQNYGMLHDMRIQIDFFYRTFNSCMIQRIWTDEDNFLSSF